MSEWFQWLVAFAAFYAAFYATIDSELSKEKDSDWSMIGTTIIACFFLGCLIYTAVKFFQVAP